MNKFLTFVLICSSVIFLQAQDPILEVEEKPRFPGCEEISDEKERNACSQTKLLEYIYANITYPKEAIENNIEGTVVITFVVEKDGSISNARIVREIGGGCGEEALRIVELMNELEVRWIPGMHKGRVVRVEFNLPVKYSLGSKKERRKRKRRKE